MQGEKAAVNPEQVGPKPRRTMSFHPAWTAGEPSDCASRTVQPKVRSTPQRLMRSLPTSSPEADAFYAPLAPPNVSDDARLVQRQAFAGLPWASSFITMKSIVG